MAIMPLKVTNFGTNRKPIYILSRTIPKLSLLIGSIIAADKGCCTCSLLIPKLRITKFGLKKLGTLLCYVMQSIF